MSRSNRLWPALFVALVVGFATQSSLASKNDANDKELYLDIFLFRVLDDLRYYVEILQMSDSGQTEIAEFVRERIVSKMESLVTFLPEAKKEETGGVVCKGYRQVLKEIHDLYPECKSTMALCEKAFTVERLCAAKGY